VVERGFARDPVTPWDLKGRPAALGSKRIGLDLRWLRLAPLCCWQGLPSEFETDFANALGALCGISGRSFRCSSHVSSWQIVLKKSFWGDERNFLEPLMRFTHGSVKGPYRSVQNRPRTFVAALNSEAAAEKSKNQLAREFWGRSIFDFCNSIGTKRTSIR
jgi:hypothetical protein